MTLNANRTFLACIGAYAVAISSSACSEAVSTNPDGSADSGFMPDTELPDAQGSDVVPGPDALSDTVGGEGGLVLNEVAPAGDPVDWFELYNASSSPIDLTGYTFSDDIAENKGGVVGGIVLQPGEYLQVLVDEAHSATFSLGSDEELAVFDASGTLVAEVNWDEGAAPSGTSWARLPDASGEFAQAEPTPGARNRAIGGVEPDASQNDTSTGDAGTDSGASDAIVDTSNDGSDDAGAGESTLVLNELVAQAPEGGADWIEIYNSGPTAVSLDGYLLEDSDPANRVVLPTGLSVPSRGYLVLTQDVEFDFGLGRTDALFLMAPDETPVDSTSWLEPSADEGLSWGRLPNGSGSFMSLRSPTPGTVNRDDEPVELPCGNGVLDDGETCDSGVMDAPACSETCQLQAPWGVVINEVLAKVTAGPDVIEIRNNNPWPVDISGWWLTDSDGFPAGDPERPFVLPAGSVVAPSGYLVKERGTGFLFGLADDGDGVTLAAGTAASVVDTTTWDAGEANEGESWGRSPNGTGSFTTLTTPTPGSGN
jgi:hypothetical protein